MIAQIDKRYLAYGIGRAARRLASYFFFEGRPPTAKGYWFNPVVLGLLRSLAAIPGEPKVEKPVFITGLGRSGTTILGTLLSLNRDVGFLNEPKGVWFIIDPRHDVNGDYRGEDGVFRMGADAVSPRARLTAHRLLGRYLTLTGAKRLVNKYPELIFRVDYLLELFPDAKIIFISRNGADACRSIQRWSKQKGKVRRGHLVDWWGKDNIKWLYLRHQVIAKDRDYIKLREVCTEQLDHLNRAAVEWVLTMREGLSHLERHPNSLIHLRYEDLVANPSKELDSLQIACNLAPDSFVSDYGNRCLRKVNEHAYPILHPVINELFIKTMKQLGYPVTNEEVSNENYVHKEGK